MSSPQPTPDQNARDIAALTQALDVVVSQFVQPSVQQANANREALDRFTEGLLNLEARLDQLTSSLEGIRDIAAQNAQQLATTAQQQTANAQQIAQNAEAIATLTQSGEEFDQRLAETRQLVAKNSSDIAQATTEIKAIVNNNAEQLAAMVEENRAFRESQQTQLSAIIGNARRIDRLEQQAS